MALQYYDDAAGILRSIVLSAIAPHRLATAPPRLPAFPRESGEAHNSNYDMPSRQEDGAFHLYADSEDGLEERCAPVSNCRPLFCLQIGISGMAQLALLAFSAGK